MMRAGTFRFYGGLLIMFVSGSYLAIERLAPPPAAVDVQEEVTCRVARVTAPSGAEIIAEVAMTREDRARGLMGREDFGTDEGMLFLYDPPKAVTMWMKDTPLSLDMIFIRNRDIEVTGIERGTTPFSTDEIASPGRVGAVLETRAGAWPDLEAGDRLEIDCLE
jgi:uncharacterized membrane protein (UPF0127 family)